MALVVADDTGSKLGMSTYSRYVLDDVTVAGADFFKLVALHGTLPCRFSTTISVRGLLTMSYIQGGGGSSGLSDDRKDLLSGELLACGTILVLACIFEMPHPRFERAIGWVSRSDSERDIK